MDGRQTCVAWLAKTGAADGGAVRLSQTVTTRLIEDGDSQLATSDRVFDLIRDRILYGDLVPGSKLTEAALATEYGVNRAPLREALLRLEERRLIERFPYSGTRVFKPSVQMLRELFEVREVLEGFACRRLAGVATEDDLAELERVINERETLIGSMPDDELQASFTTLDFHLRIAQLCGSEELQRILSADVWLYLRANFRDRDKSADKKRKGAAQHREVLRAFAAKDGELAELLMRRHIASTRAMWEEGLSFGSP